MNGILFTSILIDCESALPVFNLSSWAIDNPLPDRAFVQTKYFLNKPKELGLSRKVQYAVISV